MTMLWQEHRARKKSRPRLTGAALSTILVLARAPLDGLGRDLGMPAAGMVKDEASDPLVTTWVPRALAVPRRWSDRSGRWFCWHDDLSASIAHLLGR